MSFANRPDIIDRYLVKHCPSAKQEKKRQVAVVYKNKVIATFTTKKRCREWMKSNYQKGYYTTAFYGYKAVNGLING